MHEFRRLFDAHGVDTPPVLLQALERVRSQQDVMQEIYDDEGTPYPDFPSGIHIDSPARETAMNIRAWIGIDWKDQKDWAKEDVLVPRLSALFEAKEVLVTQVQRVPLEVMRGCALLEHPFPAIVINGADARTAKVFTLMHELLHILIWHGSQAEFLPITASDLDSNPSSNVERFCNAAAAEILMPREILLDALAEIRPPSTPWSERLITNIAGQFGVSPHAMAIQLKNIGVLASSEFDQRMPSFRTRETATEKTTDSLPL